jgi:copper chaperone
MASTLTLNIEGMTCDHCVHAVTEAIEGQPGVKKAHVDLAAKSATVEADTSTSAIDLDAILAAIAEEGYEARVRS